MPDTNEAGECAAARCVLCVRQPLDMEDLAPAMTAMKDHLISKNVATEIADKLCESVAIHLVGRKPGTFKSRSCMPLSRGGGRCGWRRRRRRGRSRPPRP